MPLQRYSSSKGRNVARLRGDVCYPGTGRRSLLAALARRAERFTFCLCLQNYEPAAFMHVVKSAQLLGLRRKHRFGVCEDKRLKRIFGPRSNWIPLRASSPCTQPPLRWVEVTGVQLRAFVTLTLNGSEGSSLAPITFGAGWVIKLWLERKAE
jgi:hypothetical protein